MNENSTYDAVWSIASFRETTPGSVALVLGAGFAALFLNGRGKYKLLAARTFKRR